MPAQPLQFSYDLYRDVITIEGVEYSGDLFRELAAAGAEWGKPFKARRGLHGIELQTVDTSAWERR